MEMRNRIKIFFLLSLFSTNTFAECAVKSASQNIHQRQVSQPINLVKTISNNQCKVKFSLNIDNRVYEVEHTYQGFDDEKLLCANAVEEGRKILLSQMGGVFQTESITVCNEGKSVQFRPAKVGDLVMDNEMGRLDRGQNFKYRNSDCRLFREKYEKNKIFRVTHGVMCKTDHQEWIIVDKW
jgi:hypothetical protein